MKKKTYYFIVASVISLMEILGIMGIVFLMPGSDHKKWIGTLICIGLMLMIFAQAAESDIVKSD